MTVAAVVLAPSLEDALREIGGVAAIRRIADIAWAGGALPIVILADAETAPALAEPLAGASGTVLADTGMDDGVSGRLDRGIAVARAQVEGTDAVLVWPGRHVHLDAETVTSLIEAHGADPSAVLAPTYGGEPGWPLLVPLEAASLVGRPIDASLSGLSDVVEAAGSRVRRVELGDPGVVHDLATGSGDLPPFEGPPEPVGAVTPDWGDRVPATDPSPTPPNTDSDKVKR